ncbi:hypothetical protein Dimus_023295 [Dionaea muscipula]
MHPTEVGVGLQYLVPSKPSPYPYFTGMGSLGCCINATPPLQINSCNSHSHNLLSNILPIVLPQVQEINPLASSTTTTLSSNSTNSDEADDQQNQSIIDERKQRRMISNRESARRSRMRKQRHLDELWSQVLRLRNENHQLIDKLNHVTQSHDHLIKENVLLKEQASQLGQMLTQLQLTTCSTYSGTLSDLEDIVNAAYNPS